MQAISNISNRFVAFVDSSLEKGVTWIRSAEARGTAAKIAAYTAALFLSLLFAASLVGIPLIYMGLKEYGRQETAANGVQHPIITSMKRLERSWVFFRRFIQDPAQVSSIIPSSSALTSEMVSKVQSGDVPRYYLEVGSGSGAITEKILEKMRKGVDHLDIVEIDPEFCLLLKDLVADFPNVTIHNQSITDFEPGIQYDAIISGLPIHGLPSAVVEPALQKYEELAKPGSTISQFEYHPILREIKKIFLIGESRRDFDRVLQIKEDFIQSHKTETVKIVENFPPAQVLHFSIKAQV